MRILSKVFICLVICSLFSLSFGCVDQEKRDKERREQKVRNASAWKACLDAGGVPIQSWYSEEIMGDCKFR